MMSKYPSLLLFLGGVASLSSVASGAIAMSAPSQQNVALSKPSFGDTAFSAPTSRGNDGIDGFANSGNWTHADFPTSATPYPGEATNAPNPYWEVDLQGSYQLDSFVVTDRVGCCTGSRLNGSLVTLFGAGGSVVGSQTLIAAAGGGDILSFDNAGLGFSGVERVRIDGVNGGNPIQYFQFSEFAALSTIQTPVNWALGAGVQYYNASGAPVGTWASLPASFATDGILNNHTHALDQFAAGYYADIDLGQEILIDSLDLTGRTDGCCPERLQDFTIEFLDASGALVHSMSQSGQVTNTANIDVIGSFGGNGPLAKTVRIVNSNGDNYGPQIGELQVYGVSVPEPSSALLTLLSVAFLAFRRR
jgi:hypothetical protein